MIWTGANKKYWFARWKSQGSWEGKGNSRTLTDAKSVGKVELPLFGKRRAETARVGIRPHHQIGKKKGFKGSRGDGKIRRGVKGFQSLASAKITGDSQKNQGIQKTVAEFNAKARLQALGPKKAVNTQVTAIDERCKTSKI